MTQTSLLSSPRCRSHTRGNTLLTTYPMNVFPHSRLQAGGRQGLCVPCAVSLAVRLVCLAMPSAEQVVNTIKNTLQGLKGLADQLIA